MNLLRILSVVFAALLSAQPAVAQWQAPQHSIPVGRGGGDTGFKSALPGAAGQILASNGAAADPSFQLWTAIVNTFCTVLPTPCAYLFGYYSPQWFGAVCTPNNIAVVSLPGVPDSASAIQAAIGAAHAANGGNVRFSNCLYKVTLAINIVNSNITLQGSGLNQTSIIWMPATPAPCFIFSAGTSILSNVGISDLSILSPDTTLTKIGVQMIDVSQVYIRNVNIAHYPIDGTLFRGGSGSIGISTNGREDGKVENVQIYAEQPIQISANPNSVGNGEDSDSWVWRDLTLVGPRTAATRPLILVDSGVSFYNTHFEGRQNWIGGKDAFLWNYVGGFISEGLYISGVKDEQAGAAGGYTFNIQASGATIFNLNISQSVSSRNGFLLRTVGNALIAALSYTGAGVGMDADLTNTLIEFRACAWFPGATSTLGAFTAIGVVHPSGFSAALPASGTLYH